MRLFGALLGLLLLGPALAADEARFAQPLKVSVAGKQAKIEFAAAAPTDCAVTIVNARGKVVRHLAAGVLGKNAPPPLQKNSLAQVLVWDGRDDYGAPTADGPFQVRVGLGLRPQLDKVIGHNPYALSSIRGLATDAAGRLYVFSVSGAMHPNDGSLTCSVFRRDGTYLRTILPHPANLPEEKTRGIRHIDLDKGVKVPFLYQGETRSLVPGAGDLPSQRPVVTRDGRVAFVGVQELTRYAQPGVAQLVVIGSDGSVPAEGVLGPVLTPYSGNTAGCLALAPDEKLLYACDVRMKAKGSAGAPTQVVYRFTWTDKEAKPFLGTLGEAGNDEKHFNEPRCVAVDGDGNIYVADRGNNRVAVFKPDGSFRGALAVTRPERVEVHPRSGAVYVLGGELVNELHRFASFKQAQPVAKATLPQFKHPQYTVVMALDASADPPVLWFGTRYSPYAPFGVLRVEDKGDSFGEPVDITRRGGPLGLGPVRELSLDRQRDRLYIGAPESTGTRDWVYDVASGKLASFPMKIPQSGGGVGLDGNFYAYNFPNFIARFGPDLKPLPFADVPDRSGRLTSPLEGTMRLRGRGVTADRQGNIYALLQKGKEDAVPGYATDANFLYLFGPDGKVKKEKLIDSEVRSLNSVRLDPQGNIYLAVGLRPGKDLLPPGLEGKLPAGAKDPNAVGGLNYYPLLYGSIVKFTPQGGAIKREVKGVECNFAFGAPIRVQGAEWIVPGASPVPSWRTPGTPDICLCESPRFDVDGFGRTFFPDACRFRIGVLDTSGNELTWFGGYGNQDSAGPGSIVPTPEIPLLWPYAVAVGDDAIYLGDRLNRRVLRLAIRYAAEATQPVK